MTEFEALELYGSLPKDPHEFTRQDCDMANKILTWWAEKTRESLPQDSCLNPVHKVYFRAGLLACREGMARFVEVQSRSIAAGIRANWWPSLGEDPGPPRLHEFHELFVGEYGEPGCRCKTAEELSPSIEALPVAHYFLKGVGGT